MSGCPPGEEAEERNNRAASQAVSQRAGASCLSRPGTSGHVSTRCPPKTSRALCTQWVCPHGPGGIWSGSSNRFLTSRHRDSSSVDITLRTFLKRVEQHHTPPLLPCTLNQQRALKTRTQTGTEAAHWKLNVLYKELPMGVKHQASSDQTVALAERANTLKDSASSDRQQLMQTCDQHDYCLTVKRVIHYYCHLQKDQLNTWTVLTSAANTCTCSTMSFWC